MKVTRKLTLPGRRESEFSSWEIELTPEDINTANLGPNPQDWLQVLCREAQARILACHAADGTISNEELTQRLAGFLGPTPDWLNNLANLKAGQ